MARFNGKRIIRVRQVARRVRTKTSDVVTQIVNIAIRGFTSGYLLASVFVFYVVASTPIGDTTNGPIGKILPPSSTNEFVVWARANMDKIFGFAIIAPVMASVRREDTMLKSTVSLLFITFTLASLTLWDYLIMSGFVYMYLHAPSRAVGFIVLLVAFLAFSSGYIMSSVDWGSGSAAAYQTTTKCDFASNCTAAGHPSDFKCCPVKNSTQVQKFCASPLYC